MPAQAALEREQAAQAAREEAEDAARERAELEIAQNKCALKVFLISCDPPRTAARPAGFFDVIVEALWAAGLTDPQDLAVPDVKALYASLGRAANAAMRGYISFPQAAALKKWPPGKVDPYGTVGQEINQAEPPKAPEVLKHLDLQVSLHHRSKCSS